MYNQTRCKSVLTPIADRTFTEFGSFAERTYNEPRTEEQRTYIKDKSHPE